MGILKKNLTEIQKKFKRIFYSKASSVIAKTQASKIYYTDDNHRATVCFVQQDYQFYKLKNKHILSMAYHYFVIVP